MLMSSYLITTDLLSRYRPSADLNRVENRLNCLQILEVFQIVLASDLYTTEVSIKHKEKL